MKNLKINRRDFCDPQNIKKLVIKKNGVVWVYLKEGYPPILKCLEGLDRLKNRLVNVGYTIHDFKVEYENNNV